MISTDLTPQIERVPIESAAPAGPLGAVRKEAEAMGATPVVHSTAIEVSPRGERQVDFSCAQEKM